MHKSWKLQAYFQKLPVIGLSAGDVLSGSSFSADQVLNAQPMEIDQIAQLFHLLGSRTPAAFATRCASQIRVSDSGLVGYAMMSAPTVRDALQTWSRFSLIAGFPMSATIVEKGDSWQLQLAPRCNLTNEAIRFCADISIAAVSPVLHNLLGRPARTRRLDLPHDGIFSGESYSDRNGVEISFGEGLTAYMGARSDLDQLNIGTNPDVHAMCVVQCLALMRLAQKAKSLSDIIEQFLCESEGEYPKIDDVAKYFSRSTRTLQRDLACEGDSYQALVDRVRRTKALNLLEEGGHSVKMISYLLGFKNPKSLRQAFKNWTGMPISSWSGRSRDPHEVQCRPDLTVPRFGEHLHLSDALASVGDRDGSFPLPHGRGDEFHYGSPGHDPRDQPPRGGEPRDIYIPDLSLEAIWVSTRDFR